MVVEDPCGNTILEDVQFDYLPVELQDLIRLNSTSCVMEPDYRYKQCHRMQCANHSTFVYTRSLIGQVLFTINNWEVVDQIKQDLAMLALAGGLKFRRR